VVGQFEGTIDKLVALAVLMPIVAGLGGNAGTQVLALMVRGLALGQIGASNVWTLLEGARVALINGLCWASGWASSCWSGSTTRAVAGDRHALTINLLTAAFGGVMVPLTLKRFGFDPALAGGVILTTLTDVMGFLSFLGLATLILLH
jgi:magnesium transporter